MKCFCATTRRAARLLTMHYEDALRPSGVTPAQFELMSELRARPGLSQMELSKALRLDQTTLSRNLRLIVENRWLKRVRSLEDRRKAGYTLTTHGDAVWRTAAPLWQRTQQQMQRMLGDNASAILLLLDRLDVALETSPRADTWLPGRGGR